MGTSAVSNTSDLGGAASAQNNGSVALSNTLSRCQQQLGDWMACPSAKTPEGKKIIDNLRVRIARLEDQVARSRPVSKTAAAPAGPNTEARTGRSDSQRTGTLGGLVNLYA
jgi:hypothetical protein